MSRVPMLRLSAMFAVVFSAVACGDSSPGVTPPPPDVPGDIADDTPPPPPDVPPPPPDVPPPPPDVQDPPDVPPPPPDVQDPPDVPAVCTAPMLMCGERCTDPQTDSMNCGMCGRACPMGQSCVAGACACLMGRMACGGTCVDVQNDTMNCGACGTMCPSGQMCVAGSCACPMGLRLCGGACIDTNTDTANCGACGNACPASQSCQAGACACMAGRTACGTAPMVTCVDAQSDNANCGMCGRACAMGQTCVMGACACPMGQSFCDGACVTTATSGAHCGRCDNACGTAQTCTAGACACPMGQTACGTSCVNVQTDSTNCGMCGRACPMGQVCTMGMCGCPMGQTACTAAGVTVCADTRTSNTNCGRCNNACPMGQSCVAGLCGSVPANDTRAGAIVIPLTAPTTINTVDTTGASNHTMGPSGCSCTSGRDVFYTFTLTQEEIVYADTHDGQTWDTSLFLQNAMGANLTPASADSVTCSDDTCATTRSQVVARLTPGQYYLVLSGCSQGRATVRFQHLPVGSGTVTRVSSTSTGTQTVMGTVAPGTGRINGGCGSDGPENMFFFTTCPLFPATRMHLTTCGTATWDTVLHQHSPARSPVSVCNDDFCNLQSSLEAALPPGAGLHAWYLDTFGSRAPGAYSLRYRFGDCSTDFAACTGVCRYTAGDDSNCGACGRTCTVPGQSCVMSTCACATGQTVCGTGAAARCANTATDNNNCGMCGRVCSGGSTCVAGACAFSTSTRDVTVSGVQTINTFAASANATAGSNRVTITNVTGTLPAVGELVLLHQTQRATGALGYYEYRRVASVVMATPAVIVLDANVTNTYATSDAPFARAQILRVEEVRNLTVPAGATLTAPAWNGNTGGILAVTSSAAVTVAGAITMDGRGFRGRGHSCIYRCARGFQGEGIAGIGGANIAANLNGGGGGGAGQDDASGGGGGYAAAGGAGGNGSCGACREACPIPGGAGGALTGSADLAAAAFLGGAGGEGGADEDGGNPGAGGNGGGIVLVRANTIINSGTIASRGNAGAGGNQGACGGVGCGMGGGGAGAGGAVRLQALASVTVGTNLVQVGGGAGGGATCGSARGGLGAVGRIGVNAPSIVGSTTPSFDRN